MAESRAMAAAQSHLPIVVLRRGLPESAGVRSGGVLQVPGRRRAGSLIVAAASDESGGMKKDPRRPSEGIFSFVTDNESSRNAIQLPNAPAMDGNLGQMITQIENKGRDYGSYLRAGEFRWWVRETGSRDARNGTVVFLHGAPTQSYSYRVVLEQMAKEGYHCYAPDWIGFGFSEKPQPEYEFSYTEEAYHEEFDKLLAKLDISSPFYLVTQGFITGSYGLTWALKNPTRVKKVVAMNTPLTPSAPLPGIFQQLRFPLVGEFTCQNAILPERFVEAGSPYVLELDDADVYRLPYLDSSDPGFSLLAAARKAPLKDLTTRIAQGFASSSWKVPTTVAWGVSDKHLPKSEAENFVKTNPDVLKAVMLDGTGHLPQEDWYCVLSRSL
uniref:AB hydrolase-1 domain-containing protein n=1 Tax=Physcomitrium patens TaxID=3218 RepID=A0A7I4BA16_PHYPA